MKKKHKHEEYTEHEAPSAGNNDAHCGNDGANSSVDSTVDVKESIDKASGKIHELEKELAESRDKYLRLYAEFENYRKRGAKELAVARSSAQIDTVMPFLMIYEHYMMALDAGEKTKNLEAMRDGLKMILAEFRKAVEELGIEQLTNCVGSDFDPNIHEAIQKEHSDEHVEGKIIKQWGAGFKMKDRLLKPATVVVSAGPAPSRTENGAKTSGNS
ncbi:MAG: nucleotide exchange factor GrpE [Lentisphaerae bacterium GWF2_44_16]|nr:MAG: nucleotide exchange factor GrpE [Lentisphaerae bacterium GWF2_44_16]